MIDFYEKEDAILGDQTATLEERQQSIKENIAKLKESLEAERQGADISAGMDEDDLAEEMGAEEAEDFGD